MRSAPRHSGRAFGIWHLQAERAKPKSCKDDMMIAPGNPASREPPGGNPTKNEHLPFYCFAPKVFGAKQKKGRLVGVGVFPRTALVSRLSRAIIGLPFQGGRWSLLKAAGMRLSCEIWPNQASSLNRRPRFTFVALLIFDRHFCAPRSLSAAVSEPQRSAICERSEPNRNPVGMI